MELVRVSVRAESDSVSLVQGIIRYYAGIHGIPSDEIERFLIPVEEAIALVIEYGFPGKPDSMFDVSVGIEGLDLTVTIIDKGIPYDYDMLEGNSEAGVSLRLLKGFADKVSLTSIGSGGRKQVLMKHLSALPQYDRSSERLLCAETSVPEGIQFDFHILKREEAIEVAQCMYDEFGYTYLHEIVYYPEEFYRSVQRGECISMVATAPNGEVAGHLALVRTSVFPGTMEMCMGVVKKKYRNYRINSILTAKILEYARTIGLVSVNAMPVIYHVYTQKSSNRMGMYPCGFMFNITNDDMSTSFKNGVRSSGTLSVLTISDVHREIYIRTSVEKIVSYILSHAGVDRNLNLVQGNVSPIGESSITVEVDTRGESGRIVINHVGSDIIARLRSSDSYLRTQNCKVIMLYLAVNVGESVIAYDAAVELGFFCTGLFMACSDRDYLIMESVIFSKVDYNMFQTIEPFTGLLNLVKEGDPRAD